MGIIQREGVVGGEGGGGVDVDSCNVYKMHEVVATLHIFPRFIRTRGFDYVIPKAIHF